MYPTSIVIPIASKCCAATARSKPLTAISHGTAHRPCIAMNDPVPSARSGAIHQKRGCANTERTPVHCARTPIVRDAFGVSGTRHQIASAAAQVATASATKIQRHETKRSANSSGAVAIRAPALPATIIQPPNDA